MEKQRLYLGLRLAIAIVLAAMFVSGLPGAAEAAPGEAGAVDPAPQQGGGDLPLQAVSAGDVHTCGLRPDGSLLCWGWNDDGQTNVPALPAGLTYTQLSAGGYHTCGLHSDGSLACWGDNYYSQTNVPALPAGLTYTQVSAGGYHTCGLRSDGSLACWGRNNNGQTSVPALPAGLTYTQVSAGYLHTCGLRSDGSLACWGYYGEGQTNIPVLPAGLTYTQVSAGGYHTCGLRSDGSLACWGYNGFGQTNVPALPAGLTYTQVSAGGEHTCGLRSDGSLACWGWNDDGQTNVPALPAGLTYTQVSIGLAHTCGLRSDGSLACWGDNGFGQTTVPILSYTQVSAGGEHTCGLHPDGFLACWGRNDYGQSTVPTLPAGLTYTQVSTGYFHTCGLRSDGALLCWGLGGHGQTSVPALPAGLSYTQGTAGYLHTCGLRSDGSLLCWGWNDDGQTTVPALPAGLTYTQVSGGSNHTCGLRSNGSLACWGWNDYGQTSVPALPAGLTYTQVSAGYFHTCGLRSDGSLACWGGNSEGQTSVPALPAGLTYTQVSAGYLHTCGLRSDGSLLCWGYNEWGQTNVPILPLGLTYSQVSAGSVHTCGLRSDGSLLCWGYNDYGQTTVPGSDYGTDTTPPAVLSSLRVGASPTQAASLEFTVTFSEFVVGVDDDDFTLATSGLTGAAITGVSGSGRVYRVTVNGGAGDGSLRLDVVANGSIRDVVNLPLGAGYGSGEAYTLDRTAPETGINSHPEHPTTSTLADFTFSSPDVTAVFECSLDGAAFAACTSPKGYTGLAEEAHTFAVRAIDPVGNIDPTPATFAWTIDRTAPETQIDSHPEDPSIDTQADFTFHASEAGSTFECSLDGAAFAACTSPYSSPNLVEAVHTFAVRAVDPAGNMDATPAGYTWTINPAPPSVIGITRASLNPTNASQVDFRVRFSEIVTGVDLADFVLTTSEGLSGVRILEVMGAGRYYTVTARTGQGSGTLRLDLPATASVLDLLGSPMADLPYTEGEAYDVRTHTFADVLPIHWAWRWVERLYDAGLTTGCGTDPLVFCPEEAMKRSEMAVFLERGVHFPFPFIPPAGTGLVFGDVPAGYWAAGWIEALFADGLTTGCGLLPRVYCPEEVVSRAQMAVFLLRARHGAGYVPPAPAGIFGDVPLTHWAAAWIEQLFAEGITTGCSTDPLAYCPGEAVSRAQMAVFLVRAFSLP